MSNNKYDLQIKSNYYKTPDQYEGNGVYDEYVEGCFSNGLDFRVYPFRAIFYLEIGKGKERRLIKKEYVDETFDFELYHRDPEVFFKYTNRLLDWYSDNCLECLEPTTEICDKCINGKERL